MKPTIQAGCMDCNVTTSHATEAAAVESIRTHAGMWPDHRPLIADARNDWHRAWVLDHAPSMRPLS